MKALHIGLLVALLTGSPALADDTAMMMQEVSAADLTLTAGFAHATLPNQPVAGGFVTITNNGAADDRLIAVTTDIAPVNQIHTMKMQDGVMVMRELPDGLLIPAGEAVTLQPGGNHLMFMQLDEGLIAGEMLDVTLTFEVAGDVDITLPIKPKMRMDMNHSNDGDS